MCTIIEKYKHQQSNYYVFDINRYPNEPDERQIRSICREYNCQNLSGMLIGPYPENDGYQVKTYDTSGQRIESSYSDILIFKKYLSDKNKFPTPNSAVSDDSIHQTGTLMLL